MKQGWRLLCEQLISTENTTKYSSWNVDFFKMRICPCSELLLTPSYHFNRFLLMILQHCEQHKVMSTIRRKPERKTSYPLSARHLDQVPWTVIYYYIALISSGIRSRFPEIMDVIFWQVQEEKLENAKMKEITLVTIKCLFRSLNPHLWKDHVPLPFTTWGI